MKFARAPFRPLLILLAVTGFAAGTRPAAAQMPNIPNPSNPASLGGGPALIGGQPPDAKPAPAAPSALPGAAARSDRVAPSRGGPITDPTEALFDSINRGDIASARDAIDRGADLGGQSVLGMTPLDLSVDLGRNDITFMLLSLRAGDSRSRGAGSSQTAKGAVAAGGKVANTTPGKPPAKAPARPAATARVTTPSHPAVTPVARQYAGGNGTPDPAAGFLGFGPAR